MNEMWESKIQQTNSLEYLDVWPMSITRPDAHKNPPFDCLHFCLPGPPLTWIEVSLIVHSCRREEGVGRLICFTVIVFVA